jgi:hypothetical protein
MINKLNKIILLFFKVIGIYNSFQTFGEIVEYFQLLGKYSIIMSVNQILLQIKSTNHTARLNTYSDLH